MGVTDNVFHVHSRHDGLRSSNELANQCLLHLRPGAAREAGLRAMKVMPKAQLRQGDAGSLPDSSSHHLRQLATGSVQLLLQVWQQRDCQDKNKNPRLRFHNERSLTYLCLGISSSSQQPAAVSLFAAERAVWTASRLSRS